MSQDKGSLQEGKMARDFPEQTVQQALLQTFGKNYVWLQLKLEKTNTQFENALDAHSISEHFYTCC
jgi:hypothetical protein